MTGWRIKQKESVVKKIDKTGFLTGGRMVFLTGPMGSGKTHQLVRAYLDAVARGYTCFMFENPNNNRNSSRDLANLLVISQLHVLDGKASKAQKNQYKKADILFFDEVHMYSAFGQDSLLIDFLKEINPPCVVCSGLWHDFYKGLENPETASFPIWSALATYLDDIRKCSPNIPPVIHHQTCVLTGCYKCGAIGESHFSANLEPSKGRVGDHYANCCLKCAKEYYANYVEYERENRNF